MRPPAFTSVHQSGFLGCDVRPFNPLVAALPRLLHLPASRAGTWVARVIDQAVAESNERRPGGDAVLERLSGMMFIDSARRYLDSLPEDATGWLAGLRDRFVGKALALMHERPEQAWSVDDLAHDGHTACGLAQGAGQRIAFELLRLNLGVANDLAPLHNFRALKAVEFFRRGVDHFRALQQHGVACLRQF